MKRNALCLLLTVCFSGAICGCNSSNNEVSNEESKMKSNSIEEVITEPEIPVFETDEEFLFGNWGTPPHENTGYMEYANNPNYCNIEEWTKMRDCGFNLAIPTSGPSVSEIERDLEMADQVGIKLLVRDATANGVESIIRKAYTKGYNYKQTRQELKDREEDLKSNIDTFARHPSFYGITAIDEPSSDYYEIISACQDWFYLNYPNYNFYVNLLPVYAVPKQLFGQDANKPYGYPDYVSMFADIVNPYCLSYDHYSLLADYDGTPYIKEDFLYNLNVFAQEAKKAKVPVYIYIQTMGFYSNLPLSSYEEFAWQVYTSLAFGVKSILCFQYWTQLQAEYHNNVRGGIVERDGTINPIYYEVQKVFGNVKAMEDVYLSFTWDGVKTFESGRIINDMFDMVTNQLEELNDISDVKCDNDIIIGQFKKENQYAYMVTNASMPFDKEASNIELTFEDYHYVYIIEQDRRELVKLENHVLKHSVASGEGIFVIPLK